MLLDIINFILIQIGSVIVDLIYMSFNFWNPTRISFTKKHAYQLVRPKIKPLNG